MLRVPTTGNATFDAAEAAAAQTYMQRREVNRPRFTPEAHMAAEAEYMNTLWLVAVKQTAIVGVSSLASIARNMATQLRNLGVQVPAAFYSVSSAVVANGGSATYIVGETMTVSGGSYAAQATFSIATLLAGAIATVTPVNGGVYFYTPSNAAAITGGSGGGSPTLTITWQFNPTLFNG